MEIAFSNFFLETTEQNHCPRIPFSSYPGKVKFGSGKVRYFPLASWKTSLAVRIYLVWKAVMGCRKLIFMHFFHRNLNFLKNLEHWKYQFMTLYPQNVLCITNKLTWISSVWNNTLYVFSLKDTDFAFFCIWIFLIKNPIHTDYEK